MRNLRSVKAFNIQIKVAYSSKLIKTAAFPHFFRSKHQNLSQTKQCASEISATAINFMEGWYFEKPNLSLNWHEISMYVARPIKRFQRLLHCSCQSVSVLIKACRCHKTTDRNTLAFFNKNENRREKIGERRKNFVKHVSLLLLY